MLSVCARKWGLIVSMTRFVQFYPITSEERRRQEAVTAVAAAMIANTIPGLPAVAAYQAGIDVYQQRGFPAEPHLHHQGGAIGYLAREYRVNPSTTARVVENQAFAWNPSITGTKCEDTFLVSDGAGRACELFTTAQDYPTIEHSVNGIAYRLPDILVP